jgi:hypothetical protein
LIKTDWTPVQQLCMANEANLAYASFINLIKHNYNLACQLQHKKITKKNTFQKPWMTRGLLRSIKKRKNCILPI